MMIEVVHKSRDIEVGINKGEIIKEPRAMKKMQTLFSTKSEVKTKIYGHKEEEVVTVELSHRYKISYEKLKNIQR